MKKMKTAFLLMALTALLCACGAQDSEKSSSAGNADPPAASAQQPNQPVWPTSSVQINVGYKAGGMSDLHARIVSNYLQRTLGGAFVVTNQDSSPYIAYDAVRTANTDGSQMLSAHLGMVTAYYLGNYDYLPTKDFTTIAFMQNQGDNVFAVAADSEWDDLNDLVQYAQANPGSVLAGVTAASFSELLFHELQSQGNCELKLVAGGSDTEKLINLEGGNLDVVILSASTANPYVESGDIKVLAAITDGENDKYSTTAEQGFDIAWDNGMFLLGPADMDPALVEEINSALMSIVSDSEAAEQVANLGGIIECMNVADSQARMEKRVQEIGDMVTKAGLNVR